MRPFTLPTPTRARTTPTGLTGESARRSLPSCCRRFRKKMENPHSRSGWARPPTCILNPIWNLPYSDNPEAVRAYDEARNGYERHDLQAEITSLKRAVEIDPKFTRAWLWLGEIYMFARQPEQALQAYRKAVNVDPQEALSY